MKVASEVILREEEWLLQEGGVKPPHSKG